MNPQEKPMTDEALIAEAERLREALKEIVQSCTSTPVALNDGFGTCVVTAPSMDALRKASEALKPPATKPEPDLATRVWDEAHAAYLNHQKTITIGRKDAVAIMRQALSEAEQRGREAAKEPVPDDVVENARQIMQYGSYGFITGARALANYVLEQQENV